MKNANYQKIIGKV